MKIGIVVSKKAKSGLRLGGGFYYKPTEVLYSWPEIQAHNEKKDSLPVSREFFRIVKLLERNQALEEEIKKFREKFNIPNDYNLLDVSNALKVPAGAGNYLYKISQEFKTPKWLDWRRTVCGERVFQSLFYASAINAMYVLNPIEPLGFYLHKNEDLNEKRVVISIAHAGVKKNTVLSYIENNWKQISEEIKKLSEVPRYSLSPRDLKIVDLKRQGLSYTKIAEEMSKKSGYEKDCSIEVAKTAYMRANKLISDMFKKTKEKTNPPRKPKSE